MKKFLSLVLALIMTMSLVTISAGATEYRDLTDKDEIQYEEAVAVLNRIGVITGYEDGSFRPEGELTRGAAAKIIVSLLIGPEAASNLPNATAPYPDVPASHTFAGVISYCKTAGIISGYGDGTFKPGNSLTGFAFAKMLLGALGYKSEIEGFVDTGWTMNVARVGNVTGLFDRLDFDGAGAVNRETACQLALNTLKATMVTYGGTTLVTGAQALAVQGTQAMYVTSNNREINANINRRVISATNNEMTLEFGEEHFKDLRLEHDKYDPAYDDFGRPSDQWSWKKVTIGTFPLPADFTYTTQISYREDSVATKEKALGLRGYDTYSTDHQANYSNWSSAAGGSYRYSSPFENATQITINGYDARANQYGALVAYDASTVGNKNAAPTLEEIADLTDNGVTVEVYVCPVDADFITNVVVVRTQMMKVKRIGSDYVTLDRIDPDSRDPYRDEALKNSVQGLKNITGYNAFAIDVDTVDVKDNNYDAYNTLKDLKAGDKVAVIPYTPDQNKTWEVSEAYVPETASGRLTDVGLYMNTSKTDGNATSITIGGTKYVINEWNLDMIDVKKAQINATRKDVTAYLAKDGTVLWADEIGNSDAWMIVGDYYQATNANGKVVWFAHGWTIGGEEIDVDLGTIRGEAEKYAPGELVHYILADGGTGEYKLEKPNNNERSYWRSGSSYNPERYLTKTVGGKAERSGEGVYNVAQVVLNTNRNAKYSIHPANSLIALENYTNYVYPATASTAYGLSIYDDEVNTRDASGVPTSYNETDTSKTGAAAAAWPNTDNYGHIWNYRSTTYKDDGVKFIYVSFDQTTGNVDYISTRKDAQTVENAELAGYNRYWNNVGTNVNNFNWVASPAEAYVNKDGNVEVVVIKTEPAAADLSNVVIVGEYVGLETGKNLGAENASAIANSHTREYYQGPNFDEVKTGVFKNPHSTGDIVVIRSTDSNGVMDCKLLNGGVYGDRNPDVIAAAGISALKSAADKTSKIAFYVGRKDGYTVTNQTGSKSIILPANSTIMTDTKTEGELLEDLTEFDVTGKNYSGLIKVAGAKWIDLRPEKVQRETLVVEGLSDLLDLDHETVRIKVLLNAKTATDTFRRAYAVVVMAGTKGATVDENYQAMNTFSTVDEINEALKKGNVSIKGDWDKSPALPSTEANILKIPANTKLRVRGDFNATGLRGIVFGNTNSKLVVDDKLTVDDALIDPNANVEADDVVITDDFTFSGTMKVSGDLDVLDTKELTIAGTVTVGGNVISSDSTAVSGGTIVVQSTRSLHITGNIGAANKLVTVKVGNGSGAGKNGLVTVGGSLKGKFVDQNVSAAAPTQDIAKVEGELVMSATSKLTTEKFAPTKIDLAVGATITLEKGTDSAIVEFQANGGTVTTGSEPAKIVIGGTGATNANVIEGAAVDATVTTTTGNEAAGTAAVSLASSPTLPEGVKVMANSTELSTAAAKNITKGDIVLSTTGTLPEGKSISFEVQTGGGGEYVAATNGKFTAVANGTYDVKIVITTKPIVKLDTNHALPEGVTVTANGTPLTTSNQYFDAGDITLKVNGVPEGKVAAVTVTNAVVNSGKFTAEVNQTYTVTVTVTNAPADPVAPKVKLSGTLPNGVTAVKIGDTALDAAEKKFTAGQLTLVPTLDNSDSTVAVFTVVSGANAPVTVSDDKFTAENDTVYTVTVTLKTKVSTVAVANDYVKPEITAGSTTSAPDVGNPTVGKVNNKATTADLNAVEFNTNDVKWEYKAPGANQYAELTNWSSITQGGTVKLTLTAQLKANKDTDYVLADPAPTASVEITVK